MAEADIGIERRVAADAEAIAERAVDAGLAEYRTRHAVEDAVVELGIVAVVLEQGFAVEAGQAAELAVDADVPAIGVEPDIGQVAVVVGLGPGITGGQADAGLPPKP